MTEVASVPPRNRVGVVALVLVLVAAIVPLVAWIVVAIVGAVESSSFDDAVYVGFLGGMIVFFALIGVLAPVSFAGLVLGVVSLFRPGGKAPGIVAIVIGVFGRDRDPRRRDTRGLLGVAH